MPLRSSSGKGVQQRSSLAPSKSIKVQKVDMADGILCGAAWCSHKVKHWLARGCCELWCTLVEILGRCLPVHTELQNNKLQIAKQKTNRVEQVGASWKKKNCMIAATSIQS
mmetsp:Transcript_8014/g.17391  ORF Transcript_8014/g.17391 Transcript_8014/m.17391 type:complete len:111 (+) Transcript_8014:192-524(+)